MQKKGKLFIVSAPSGAGKTTICKRVMESLPGLAYSISYTTRDPRPGETADVDYHYITLDEFREKKALGAWLESAEVHGNYYATSRQDVRDILDSGKSVVLDIDVQGMEQVTERFPEAVTLFIMPPSDEELERRLRGRKTDSEATIQGRLKAARHEMEKRHSYRYIIVNDILESAVREMMSIIEKELS